MNGSKIAFSAFFKTPPQPVAEIWLMFSRYLRDHDCLADKWYVRLKSKNKEVTLRADDVENALRKEVWSGLAVESCNRQHTSMSLALWPQGKPVDIGEELIPLGYFLHFYCDSRVESPPNWFSLIESICSRWVSFGAFQRLERYFQWQKATDLDSFYIQLYGEPPPSMKRTESPDGIILDISKNPGRSSFTNGQFRGVAAEMWLGNDFFEYAPCTRSEVLSADFFLEVREEPNFIYFKAWPEPFNRPDGEQGRVQQKLWRLLFHEDCEWPPESGGISDIPVYGPQGVGVAQSFALNQHC